MKKEKQIKVTSCQYCPYLVSKGQQRTSKDRYFLYKCGISNYEIKDDFFNDIDSVFNIPNNCPL